MLIMKIIIVRWGYKIFFDGFGKVISTVFDLSLIGIKKKKKTNEQTNK